MMLITSLLSKGLVFLLFDGGASALLQLQEGMLGLYVAAGVTRPISCTGFKEHSSVVLLLRKLGLFACTFCYLWRSRS
jgi:hypothetical protein